MVGLKKKFLDGARFSFRTGPLGSKNQNCLWRTDHLLALLSEQMLQQDQRLAPQRLAAPDASRGALPAGRAGDGAAGPGFTAVPGVRARRQREVPIG